MALGHDDAPPSLILDVGTGIRRVSTLLSGQPFNSSLLLGHLHWDHVEGLPFFSSGDNPEARVDLFMPAQGDAETVLRGLMSNPYPITPAELRGRWRFHALESGEHTIEGFTVMALDIPHKGGRCFGNRISGGTSSVAYLSDHSPTTLGPGPDNQGEDHANALELARGCDVLIHDSQYTDDELPGRILWGLPPLATPWGWPEPPAPDNCFLTIMSPLGPTMPSTTSSPAWINRRFASRSGRRDGHRPAVLNGTFRAGTVRWASNPV